MLIRNVRNTKSPLLSHILELHTPCYIPIKHDKKHLNIIQLFIVSTSFNQFLLARRTVLPSIKTEEVTPGELGNQVPRVASGICKALLFAKAKTFEEDLMPSGDLQITSSNMYEQKDDKTCTNEYI